MRSNKILTILTFAAIAAIRISAANPLAYPKTVIVNGNARFTVITPEIIRIEYSEIKEFEDRATFTIQNRRMPTVPKFLKEENDSLLLITTERLKLRYRKGSNPFSSIPSPENLSIEMCLNGEGIVWYPGKTDSLNLKGTCRTLDLSKGDNKRKEMENGIISRGGWSIIDDSWNNIRPDGSRSFALESDPVTGYDWWTPRKDPEAIDIYFLGYGHDYKDALKDFTELAGKIPLPPDYVFGYWYSKYSPYSSDDYRRIMADLKKNNIPADVMILDMDWHWNGIGQDQSGGRGGWTGWSWNTNLIPDPKQLLSEIHGNRLRVALNLHPADGICGKESPGYFNKISNDLNGRYQRSDTIDWSLDFPDFTESFFRNIIRDHEKEGVDFWWLDWQQHLTSKTTPGLGETFWCNHVFFNDMKKNRPDRRPLIFHRWGGLGSHRYQIGFSGDAYIDFPTLAFQPYFTATASNVGYGYWGHDLGGHLISDEKSINDPELILRWIQFGVFSPILRTHATRDPRIERRIWKMSNFPDILNAVRLRYSLFPYIYTMARQAYDTGISICRPLYYEHPEDDEAYVFEGEYYFGNDMIVAPITQASSDGKTTRKKIWLPEGKWWDMAKHKLIEGPAVVEHDYALTEIPFFLKAGAMIPFNPDGLMSVTDKPREIVINSVAGTSGYGSLYEDKGDNNDYDSSFAMTGMTHSADGICETFTINPRVGDSKDLVDSRSYRLIVWNSAKPEAVLINGRKAGDGAWKYNHAEKSLSIAIPVSGCSIRNVVKVIFSE